MTPAQTAAPFTAFSPSFEARPGSCWASWAPEVADAEPAGAGEPDASVSLLGGVLSLLMWGCASLLAVWYL